MDRNSLLQAASNTAADAVSMPVDAMAWLMKKAGVPIQEPVGGSDWMRRVGLTRDVDQASEMAASLAGLLVPVAAPLAPAKGLLGVAKTAKAASKAKGLLSVGDDISDATRAEKMAAMGMERGWFRGGRAPANGRRTGAWYTQDADEAANYAKRFGNAGDVREYAIPKTSGFLRSDKSYQSRLAHDLADLLSDPYYGKPGQQLAKEFRTFGPDERINGSAVWQALESRFGNDGAAEVLTKLGNGRAFSGVTGMTGGPEAMVFAGHPVRDAMRASFDPAKYAVDDIYGAADPGFLALLAGLSGAGAYSFGQLPQDKKR